MKKLTFTVDKKGKIQVDASGYQDSSCKEATRKFANLLGSEVSEEFKPEFYQGESTIEKESL